MDQETVLCQLTLTVALVLRGVVQRGLARVEVVLVVLVMMVVSVVASAGGLGVEDLRHLVIKVNKISDSDYNRAVELTPGQYAPVTLSGGADAGPCAEQRALRGDDCDGGGGAARPYRSMTDPQCSCCYCTVVVKSGEVKTKPSGFDPNSKVSVFSLETSLETSPLKEWNLI